MRRLKIGKSTRGSSPPQDMTRVDPDLPDEIGHSKRSDTVVQESDRTENWIRDPGLNANDLPRANVQVERPEGLEVEKIPRARKLRVKYKGQVVFLLKWLPQGRKWYVSRTIRVRDELEIIEHDTDLQEGWQLAMQYGVTPHEFSEAFVDVPPQHRFQFDQCPFDPVSCPNDFAYLTNPSSKKLPDLICRKCGSIFSTDKMGGMTLKVKGDGCPLTTSSASDAERSSRSSEPVNPVRRKLPTPAAVEQAIADGFLDRGQGHSGQGFLEVDTTLD